MNHKAHFKGDIQVDGAVVGSDGHPVGSFSFGSVLHQSTSVRNAISADMDAYAEIVPMQSDHPYLLVVKFGTDGSSNFHAEVGSSQSVIGQHLPLLSGDAADSSITVMLGAGETYYIAAYGGTGHVTVNNISEIPLI